MNVALLVHPMSETTEAKKKYVSLKVFLGNLTNTSYVLMAAKDHAQFLQASGCLKQHSFGQVHSAAFINVALARPGIPLVRKIHDLAGPWLDMTVVLPNRGARKLTQEEMRR